MEIQKIHYNSITLDKHKIPYDCIVLDLDDTLVFSSKKRNLNIADSINVSFLDMHGDQTSLWIHKRPGFNEFLDKCFKNGKVGVWSMGQPGYVAAVVSLFPQTPEFVYNWCQCDRYNGKIFKRLDRIPCIGNIAMIDDQIRTLELCKRIETIIIPKWSLTDNSDTELYNISLKLFL